MRKAPARLALLRRLAPIAALFRPVGLALTAGVHRLGNPDAASPPQAAAELARCREALAAAEKGRRAAELALIASTDKLRSMVSALPVGVMTIGRDGRVELWNRAAADMLGYTAEEMMGRPMPTAVFSFPPERGPAAAGVYLRLVTGQTIKSEEVICRRKDGSSVDASFSGIALMDEDERLNCAICVFEDFGQRKFIAQQLQQAQKMEAVGQLTGGLAHDVNNILGIAIGNLDLLEGEVGDRPEALQRIEAALSALLRGADLTRALLAFSRRQPLQPTRVDVAELLGGATRMLGRVLGEQVKLSCLTEADLWPALADAAQLEAAITNLAINARDAMPGGGRLAIAARNAVLDEDYARQNPEAQAGDYVLIELSDTGVGIAPELLARVFEPFVTTKPVGKGTGLGLSMVYGFIKQSGGHIKIYSEVGLGTTVRLYLPRAAAAAIAAGPAKRDEAVSGGSETVLVVEDNAEVRRMVNSQLTSLGYRVVLAEHGPAGLAALDASERVDLLFTDIVMPEGMSGFELAEAALRRRPGLKILFTSGFPGRAIDPPAAVPRPIQFLSKPYRRQDLARKVRAVLDSKGAGG